MNYEPRTTNWPSQKQTHSNPFEVVHTPNPKQRSALEVFTYVPKGTNNGNVCDNFGSFLDKFGVVLDNNGNVSDNFGNTNTPINRIFKPKNHEKTNFSHQISS